MISETTIKCLAQAKGLLELCIQGAENRTTDEEQTERWLEDVIKFCRMAILHLPGEQPQPASVFNTCRPDVSTTTDYCPPPYELLKDAPQAEALPPDARAEMVDMQQSLCSTMSDFKISMEPGNITRGPAFTRYEFFPPNGLRVNKVLNIADNLMMTAQAKAINILAPIPGKNTIGIELENKVRDTVYLKEILQSKELQTSSYRIPVALGKDVYGTPIIADLTSMPHLLIAGNADSGKSVCINSMLLSMLYKFGPNELKLILADPKIVDMQPYRKLPHLLCPLLTAPERVIGALRWVVNEMEHRLNLFQLTGVSNVEEFNNRANNGEVAPYTEETTEQADIDSDSLPAKLPYIVIIINELADYMMLVKEDLENYIARLTQKARAAGIHLIAATQTTRANVITGILKANIPSRMAFKVTSPLDSRIILDTGGADKLLGKGDFLYLPAGGITKMTRIQGAFVSDVEVARVAKHCAEHNAAEITPTPKDCGLTLSAEEEELYERAVQLVKNERKASTSLLQRRFSIGYGRAAKIIDMMESRGVIGPVAGNSSRPREVLI